MHINQQVLYTQPSGNIQIHHQTNFLREMCTVSRPQCMRQWCFRAKSFSSFSSTIRSFADIFLFDSYGHFVLSCIWFELSFFKEAAHLPMTRKLICSRLKIKSSNPIRFLFQLMPCLSNIKDPIVSIQCVLFDSSETSF